MLGVLGILALALLAYWPVTKAGYIWDDDEHVVENLMLRDAEGLERIWFDTWSTPQYYPLTHTTFWIEYQLWGAHPLGYHLVNVVLHALCAIGLWRVLEILRVPGAFLAAVVFAVHPVHVESVAWITERKNVLCGALFMLAAIAYLRFLRFEAAGDATGGPAPDTGSKKPRAEVAAPVRRWDAAKWYVAALAAFTAALLSKTVACTLPAVLLVVLWMRRGRVRRRDVAALVPLFVLGLAAGLMTARLEQVRVGAQGAAFDWTLVERCLIAGRAVWFYLGKLLCPVQLAFFYPRWEIDAGDPLAYVYPIAALATVAGLWAARGKLGRGPLAAALYFGITLFPAMGFFNVYPMKYSLVADHFQYLASAGPIALVAALVVCLGEQLRRRPSWGALGRRWTAYAALLLAVALGLLTWLQSQAYADEETLYRDTIAKNPYCWIAYNNLGVVLDRQNRTEEARTCYAAAVASNPDYACAHKNLGGLLLKEGKVREAAPCFEEALRAYYTSRDPDYASDAAAAHLALGLICGAEGKVTQSRGHFEAAAWLDWRIASEFSKSGLPSLPKGQAPR